MIKFVARKAVLAPLMLTLAACAHSPSFDGPARIVARAHVGDTAGGAQYSCTPAGMTADGASADAYNLAFRFQQSVCDGYNAPIDSDLQREMLDRGFTLVAVRCNDFFAQRAGNQMRGRVTRSMVAPITTAITGIAGLVNFSKDSSRDDFLTGLALASAFTTSTLDSFEEEFLFGADNVDSVRILTMRTLDTHRETVLATATIHDFDSAVRALTYHQMLCTPAHILSTSREAIRNGQLEAVTRNSGTEVQVVQPDS